MLFNTIDFIIFLITVVIVYYAIPQNRGRKIFLLLASYYFYACWNVAFLGLLLFDTIGPLQCSCLDNPRDEGAWWAAIYGVATELDTTVAT